MTYPDSAASACASIATLPPRRVAAHLNVPRNGERSQMVQGRSPSRKPQAKLHAGGQLVGPVAVLPRVLRELGVDPADVLRECGLVPDALDDPQGRIPFGAVGAMLECSVRRTGCEHLGLLAGQQLGLAQMGMVGQLARHAPSVGEALAALSVHQHLNSSGSLAFLGVDGDRARMAATVYTGDAVGLAYLYDAIAVMICNVMRELAGPGWRPDAVLLARSRPASLLRHRHALGDSLVFDAEYTGVHFPIAILGRKVPGADPVRFAELEAGAAALGRHSLVNDLRRALRVELIAGHASASRVSHVLDMHRRTLNRRLAGVGTTFQAVLDDVRFDAARQYLLLTDMPLVAIAAALGYSELSAFARAFRRWSGVAPGRFRADGAPPAERTPPAHRARAGTKASHVRSGP